MRQNDLTLNDVYQANALRYANHTAFHHGKVTTHGEFHQRSLQLAAGLHGCGIGHGDRVAILSRNRMEFMELIGAAARLGAVVSAINWRLSAAEVTLVLEGDDPKLVLVEDEFWHLLDPTLEKTGVQSEPVCLDGRKDGFRCMRDLYTQENELAPSEASADDPLLFIHTAWSDQRPKAAMLSHRNLIANAVQLQSVWQLGAKDVHLCCLPLFHSTAVSLTFATQLAGGSSVLSSKFDAVESLALIQSHQVTLFAEFAPMLDSLLETSPAAAGQLASVRHVCGLDTPGTIRKFEAACPDATFWSGYGQTEASGLVTLGRFRDVDGAVGHALPLCAVEILDGDGHPLPLGDQGEITVRGPAVFLGYWNRPSDNTWVFRSGRLHTGDAGRLDAQGRLWYAGRLPSKELIKTGGENVYPQEVEAVLRQHPALADVAVIGVADPKWGEAVRAVCVRAAGKALQQRELIDFVGARIAHFKRPRSVLFVDALPKKADGSNDRDRIRTLYGDATGG
jgi:acyl-CoA synthetase (AMP-forming)/AMP-acid ligase II